MKEAAEPGSMPGSSADAELHGRVLVAGQRDVEVAGAHHADLAGAELQVERLAVLGAGALMDVAGLDHGREPTASTCLTPSPTSGSSPAPAASILAPEAHISGPTVKMLQPAQEPGR